MIKNILEKMKQFREGVSQLSTVDRQLRDEHAAALKERTRIIDLFEPVETIVENMRTLVDTAVANFTAEHAFGIAHAFSGHLELKTDGHRTPVRPQFWAGPRSDGLRFEDLCAIAPDLMKARLEGIIRSSNLEHGLPIEQRAAAIAAADERIREIEDKHAELVDQAAALDPPIVLKLLPAVRERRANEAARQRREAAAREAQREAEEVLNRSRIAQPRVGQSEYLKSQRGPFAS